MPSSNPASILLAHNRWATHQIIDFCRPLTGDQFHQTFEMGEGSLYDSLVHILAAMRGWGDLLAGREQREGLEKQGPYTLDQLAQLLDEIANDFDANTMPHDDIASGERGGKTYAFTRGTVVTHVTTHGMHHRAQCCNMLRQLGVEGPFRVSVVEWTFTADASSP